MTEATKDKLVDALKTKFGDDVEAEQVRPGRYRIQVVSPLFNEMTPLERQDAAWNVVDQTVSRDDAIDISLVITYATNDIDEWSWPSFLDA